MTFAAGGVEPEPGSRTSPNEDLDKVLGSGSREAGGWLHFGRATNAVLTEAGAEFVAQATPGHLEAARSQLLGALTEEQLQQLAAISGALVDALDPQRRPSDACASIVQAASS